MTDCSVCAIYGIKTPATMRVGRLQDPTCQKCGGGVRHNHPGFMDGVPGCPACAEWS